MKLASGAFNQPQMSVATKANVKTGAIEERPLLISPATMKLLSRTTPTMVNPDSPTVVDVTTSLAKANRPTPILDRKTPDPTLILLFYV
jgi:hypothetical protein